MLGIGFDFDHTLGVDNKLERTALLRVIAREPGQTLEDPEELGRHVDEALRAYRSGEVSLDASLLALFAESCSEQSDLTALLQRFRDEAIALAPRHIEALPGARELLSALHEANVPTAILTNGWNPLQQRKAELIGFTGPVIVSDDLGVRKPNVQAFSALASTLQLPAADILYVGDAPPIDIVGALDAGMRAIWFDWENHPYDTALPQPTHIVHALRDLGPLVFATPRRAW